MMTLSRKSKVLTISGGKGGTGKTFTAVNLAVEMANRLSGKSRSASMLSNNRVLLFDADFHLSNAHIFLGQRVSPILDRFLNSPGSLPEYIINTEYGIDLISFGGDERKVNTIKDIMNEEVLEELRKLETIYDWIILDTGAGLDSMILQQILFSDVTLLVTNPETTAIMDCYKQLKFLSLENPDQSVEICINEASSFEAGYACFEKIKNILTRFGVPIDISFAGPIKCI